MANLQELEQNLESLYFKRRDIIDDIARAKQVLSEAKEAEDKAREQWVQSIVGVINRRVDREDRQRNLYADLVTEAENIDFEISRFFDEDAHNINFNELHGVTERRYRVDSRVNNSWQLYNELRRASLPSTYDVNSEGYRDSRAQYDSDFRSLKSLQSVLSEIITELAKTRQEIENIKAEEQADQEEKQAA